MDQSFDRERIEFDKEAEFLDAADGPVKGFANAPGHELAGQHGVGITFRINGIPLTP